MTQRPIGIIGDLGSVEGKSFRDAVIFGLLSLGIAGLCPAAKRGETAYAVRGSSDISVLFFRFLGAAFVFTHFLQGYVSIERMPQLLPHAR